MAKRTEAYPGRCVYVVDGARTPFLKARGRPGPFPAADLAVAAGRALLARHPFDPVDLDEVVLGSVMPGPDEANIGRVAALRLGAGKQTPAWTVQRNCASGMQALDSAALHIASGRSDLVLAGGSEAMSHAPVLWNHAMVNWLADWQRMKGPLQRLRQLSHLRPALLRPVFALLRGLSDPIAGLSMGQTAENLAHRFGISREAMDEFALQSHRRLADAVDHDRLDEIEPLYGPDGGVYPEDDGLRRNTSMEILAGLRPVFDRECGQVTAGNSAQITDGAAWLLLASEESIKRFDLPVLGRLADGQWAGLAPEHMGLGPVHAAAPLLQRHDLALDDIDYWEINEAFATQVLACLAAWRDERFCRDELELEGTLGEIDRDRLNIDGGAVSIGHPVGASGARIVLHLLKVLQRRGAKRGIAALCIGGGQGGAMLVEQV